MSYIQKDTNKSDAKIATLLPKNKYSGYLSSDLFVNRKKIIPETKIDYEPPKK